MPDAAIPDRVDAQLRAAAERAAGAYPDPLLSAMGWTRAEYVDAIHNRLREQHLRITEVSS
jgi:hypothetical protein